MKDHGAEFADKKMEYECHITVRDDFEMRATWKAQGEEYGWKTSHITGDPLLGKDSWFYFTKHCGSYPRLKADMMTMSAMLGNGNVVRQKIEAIVFDTKTKHLTEPTLHLGMTQGQNGKEAWVGVPSIFARNSINGNTPCDMLRGHCACGASHDSTEWMLVRL